MEESYCLIKRPVVLQEAYLYSLKREAKERRQIEPSFFALVKLFSLWLL